MLHLQLFVLLLQPNILFLFNSDSTVNFTALCVQLVTLFHHRVYISLELCQTGQLYVYFFKLTVASVKFAEAVFKLGHKLVFVFDHLALQACDHVADLSMDFFIAFIDVFCLSGCRCILNNVGPLSH